MINHSTTILSIIKSYPGDANKRTQAEITDECIARGGVNICEREVRRIFVELINEGALIIGTPNGGYYWAETEDEIIECVNRLRKKACKIFIRARRLKRNWLLEKARRSRQEQLSLLEVG